MCCRGRCKSLGYITTARHGIRRYLILSSK
nr:MAG TPA: hypothetical protein [Caudoviricetes sp.]DAX53546.1 MAG TPA: hypothetical protein [Caudoviricetes sp.]